MERKLPESILDDYKEQLALFKKILEQKRTDKNKIYSIHKPFTSCIAKGKAHKKYEYGNKTGLVINPKERVILGIETFEGNPHDSNTIEPLLDQIESNFNYLPEEVVYDRGGRGKAFIKGVKISTPKKPKKTDTQYQKRKERKKFRSRAGIEPVIGHLKSDFRMAQNYLHGMNSPKMNAMMAAAGWNFKKKMEKLKKDVEKKYLYLLLRLKYLSLILSC